MRNEHEIRTMQKAICLCLDSLVGPTYPQADTTADTKIQEQNLPLFGAVCDWVAERIEVAAKHRNSPYGSAKETARLTLSYADILSSFWNIQDDFDNDWLEDYGWTKK